MEMQLNEKQKEMEKQAIKENTIRLADHHRKHCNGACNISLYLLRKLLEMGGITLTREEKGKFF